MRKYKYIDILTNIKCNRNSTICYLFTCYCNSKYTHTHNFNKKIITILKNLIKKVIFGIKLTHIFNGCCEVYNEDYILYC